MDGHYLNFSCGCALGFLAGLAVSAIMIAGAY
jgi:hypothetical protein